MRLNTRKLLAAMLTVGAIAASVGGTASAAQAATPVGAPAAAVATTAASTAAAVAAAAGTAPKLPPVNAQFDYQIGGVYSPSASVGIVDRDHTAKPASNAYNICYVNAFQTQPDDTKTWAGANSDLILKDAKGTKVGDPEWGEYLLDTSTAAKRTRIAAIVNRWIDECATKHFNAVEPDNLDSWTRSTAGGKQLLSKQNNIDLATLLAAHAHAKGLAIAQKNTTDLGSAGKKTVGFDFAIAEECQANKECDAYTKVYGNNVIEIEYTDNDSGAYTKACAAQGKTISVILRDRDVVAKGTKGYVYKYC